MLCLFVSVDVFVRDSLFDLLDVVCVTSFFLWFDHVVCFLLFACYFWCFICCSADVVFACCFGLVDRVVCLFCLMLLFVLCG